MPYSLPDSIPAVPWRTRGVTTDDAVSLAIHDVGEGPPVLLANGIGVGRPGLDHLADHLRRRRRVITWDYRGVGASRVGRRTTAFSIERHAEDALRVLDALGVERAGFLGWSMGVPVGLELIRRAPARVTALGALFGPPGRPFARAFAAPAAGAIHLAVRASRELPLPVALLARAGALVPPVAWLVCTASHFVGPAAHRAVFHRNVSSVAGADKRAYLATLHALCYHDASDVLGGIRCPVLVVAGDLDPLTPVRVAEEMAAAVPGARLVVLSGASHFGVIEYGPQLWAPIDELLAAGEARAAGAAA